MQSLVTAFRRQFFRQLYKIEKSLKVIATIFNRETDLEGKYLAFIFTLKTMRLSYL